MIAPILTANPQKQQENFIKVTTGNATVNQTSLSLLKGMVTSEHHTQKLEARDRLTDNARPIQGRQGEERGGETTGRGNQGPKRLTRKVVL